MEMPVEVGVDDSSCVGVPPRVEMVLDLSRLAEVSHDGVALEKRKFAIDEYWDFTIRIDFSEIFSEMFTLENSQLYNLVGNSCH